MAFLDDVKGIFGPSYYEVAQDAPTLIYPKTVAAGVLGNSVYKWVTSYILKVRSLGSASYIGVGNVDGQNWRLTIVGEQTGFAGNNNEVCDLSRVYTVSDANDPVLELIASYIPLPYQDKVTIVDRSLMT